MQAFIRARAPIAAAAALLLALWIIRTSCSGREQIERNVGGWCGYGTLHGQSLLTKSGYCLLLLPLLYALAWRSRICRITVRLATVAAVTWWVCNHRAVYPDSPPWSSESTVMQSASSTLWK